MLEDNFFFFFSGRYNNDKGYLYGIRQHTVYDSLSRDPLRADVLYLAQTGDNSIVSMNPNEDINTSAKITYKPNTNNQNKLRCCLFELEISILCSRLQIQPDANYKRFQWGIINSLEYRQAISSTTFSP